MDVHADPVTEPMVKKTAETCLLDDGAGFGVDVLGLRRPAGSRRFHVLEPSGQFDRSSRTWE